MTKTQDAELPSLNAAAAWAKQHHRLLELVYSEFEASGAWPNLSTLQRTVLRIDEHLDVLGSGPTIPIELGRTEGHPPRCILTVRGVAACAGRSPLLDHVVRVVQLATQRYLTSDLPVEELHLRSEDVRDELNLTDAELLRVGRLVLDEPLLFSGGWSANADAATGPWDRQLNDGLRHFRGITSIQDYLDVQARHHWRPFRSPSTWLAPTSIPLIR